MKMSLPLFVPSSCTNLEMVQIVVMSAPLSSITCTMSARPQSTSLAYGDCQLGCKVSAHWQIVSSSEICKLSFKCSAAIPWLNRNLSAQPHTVMDLQVCAPELATASPSAIAGCADKLEFCKVLYVPIGGPAHRCAALQSLLHLMIRCAS